MHHTTCVNAVGWLVVQASPTRTYLGFPAIMATEEREKARVPDWNARRVAGAKAEVTANMVDVSRAAVFMF